VKVDIKIYRGDGMKRLLLGLLVLGVMNRSQGYVGYKHSVKDESGSKIRVRLDYHGASAIACRKDVGDVQAGTERTWKSYGCQLKKIEITQNIDGKDVVTSLNVRNVSVSFAMQAGAALAIAESDASITGAIGSSVLVDRLLKGDLVTAELVAYGSTSWVYKGPNQLIPVGGVKVYKKK